MNDSLEKTDWTGVRLPSAPLNNRNNMSAIIMLGAATAAVTACSTATSANSSAGALAAGYGPAMAVTLGTTFPIITVSMGTIITTLTPAFPLQISPLTAKVRPEDARKVLADLATISLAITSTTGQSVASAGAPSPSFPDAVADVSSKLGKLSSFITKNFVTPLTF